MSAATDTIKFIETLHIPTGPLAGQPLKLAPFQKDFIKGALADDVNIGVLSIGRGNGKSALVAAIALAELLGVIKQQPLREILVAAKTRDQAQITWAYAQAFCKTLPADVLKRIQYKRSPRLEIEYHADGGGHVLRAIAADGKGILGASPTLIICDERGHWPEPKGTDLENALLTALPKRRGRALIVSTSASTDQHPFSLWLDNPQDGVYRQQHKAPPDLPADDIASLKAANPGYAHGLVDIKDLQKAATRAIQRGGTALTSFRLYNRNERISSEARQMLLMPDDWRHCEAIELPPREGPCVVGLDAGGSASMSAAAYYWPQTGRLETHAWFPSNPNLSDRGLNDSVGNAYVEMQQRGELSVLGDQTVPVANWIGAAIAKVSDQPISAVVADRFKAAELKEGLTAAKVAAPIVWRGMGFRDGNEDADRFRRAVYDRQITHAPSLLMRTALSESVIFTDPAGNIKLVKGRANGRIDVVAAAIIAVAEGARQNARPKTKPRLAWA